MRRNTLILACLVVALVPLTAAHAARSGARFLAPRGDLLITFSGTGGGGYHFRQAAVSGGGGCRSAETSYGENDTYSWSFTFVVPPSGGSSDEPVALNGSGQLISTQTDGRCAGNPVATTTCTLSLHAPQQSDGTDLAYPGVNVVVSGRQITVGALGELVSAAAGASCDGDDSFQPNPVAGYPELQASVSFPRSTLSQTGDVRTEFTMAGAGLYDGVPLSGSCNSLSCDSSNCTSDLAEPGPSPTRCAFGQGYSGTIEVRVVK